MKKWLWNCIKWNEWMKEMEIWLGDERVEKDIEEKKEKDMEKYVWEGFYVDGRDVVMKGMDKDKDMKREENDEMENVWDISEIKEMKKVLKIE